MDFFLAICLVKTLLFIRIFLGFIFGDYNLKDYYGVESIFSIVICLLNLKKAPVEISISDPNYDVLFCYDY